MERFRTKKRFGQHFLNDEQVLLNISAAPGLKAGDHCIEIGPGQGALTHYLINTKATVVAVELDKRLQPGLEKLASQHENFSFIMSDVLDLDWDTVLTGSSFVVGNLPYEISTPLLFSLIPWRSRITKMVFLLQKEVVERMVATVGSKDYGRLSVMMQYYFAVEGLFMVGPEAFSPPPKVDSQVVQLTPIKRDWVDHNDLEVFVKYVFAERRKMLRKRFKGLLTDLDWQKVGIDPSVRPQNLDIDAILVLMQYCKDNGIVLNAGDRI